MSLQKCKLLRAWFLVHNWLVLSPSVLKPTIMLTDSGDLLCSSNGVFSFLGKRTYFIIAHAYSMQYADLSRDIITASFNFFSFPNLPS